MRYQSAFIILVSCTATFAASPVKATTLATTTIGAASDQSDYIFTNNGDGTATFDTASGGAPVNFTYTSSSINGTLDSSLQGSQNAHLFLNSTTSSQAGSGFGGLFDVQPIDSGTIQVLLDTPVDGKSNLLTATFTNGIIDGANGGSTPAFSDQDGSNGGTVSYTSDFLNFTGSTTGNNYQYISSNSDPGLSIDSDGLLASFSGTGLTTFSFDNTQEQANAVPEPTSIALLGIAGLGLLRRRRRLA